MSGSGSQPRTDAPARRAASAAEAPIRTVPMTVIFRSMAGLPSHQLGDPEREVERLTCVQARVTERFVARVELLFEHGLGAAEALGHVLAGDLEVDASGPGADLAMGGEEPLDLTQHVVEPARLVTGAGDEAVRVHRIADPDDWNLGLANGAQERRQELLHAACAEARDERQPPGHALGVEPFGERDELVRRHRRADLGANRIVEAREEL